MQILLNKVIVRIWFHLELICIFHVCFRAIYFAAYSKSKEIFNGLFVPNSGLVHMSSAGVGGELLFIYSVLSEFMYIVNIKTATIM